VLATDFCTAGFAEICVRERAVRVRTLVLAAGINQLHNLVAAAVDINNDPSAGGSALLKPG
jgi:hypothetical protein